MIVREAKITYKKVGTVEVDSMDKPEKVFEYVKESFEEYADQEQMIVIPLNRKEKPLGFCRVSLGTVNSCLCHPREIMRPVILAGASAFVIAHNHPSGDPAPSQADLRTTRAIAEAARIFDIDFLDHVIVGETYYSFAEKGLM